jgi:hypothetical protein
LRYKVLRGRNRKTLCNLSFDAGAEIFFNARMAQILHPVVVLKPVRATAGFIAQMRAVIAAMQANKQIFAKPNPPLNKVSADVDALEQKQAQALLKMPGAVQERKDARDVVDIDAKLLVAYVQALVIANPAQALAIAQAANMSLKTAGDANLAELAGEPGDAPGTVKLVAHCKVKRGKNTIHDWRYTPDGTKACVNAPSTPVAHTTITGLPSLTYVGFQHRVRNSSENGNWSATVTVLVP